MIRSAWTGASAVAANLLRMAREFPGRVMAALEAEAEIEMAESKRRVPVDTGVLRASGYVSRAHVQPLTRRVSIEVGYGGAASDYAVPVHEDLDAFHTVGEAKYLESVLRESAPFMADRLARRLQLGLA